MVKKLTASNAGFLLHANLNAVDGKASHRKRQREKKEQHSQEVELPAEKAPRAQGRWLEEERKQTKLPAPGRSAQEAADRAEGSAKDFDAGGDGVVGRKKARRMKVLEAKKARAASKKDVGDRKAHASAAEALKGKAKAKDGHLSVAASDLLNRCRRDVVGEQRLLAYVAERVSGNPEKELELFDVFFELHANGASAAVRTFALLSAVAVFKDLVPGYRIREPTEAERTQMKSKGVLSLERHEMALLQTYRRLLPALEAAMKRDALRYAFALAALVKAASDFNYQKRLLTTAVRYASCGDEDVRRAVAGGLQDMLEADTRLESSKEVVLAVGSIAQQRAAGKGAAGGGLHIELLQVFLRLQVGRAEAAALQEDTGAMRDADDETRRGLAEASITQSAAHLLKAEAELLYEVFCVYLRILRQRHLHGRKLIANVLVGLSRWGQHVNLELLLEILHELKLTVQDAIAQSDELVALQGLNCALVLLSGPSQALITDATWLSDALTQAFALSLPSLHSTHSESAEWPPARCYELTDGTRVRASAKELEAALEAESVPCLVLRTLDNAMRCPHGFGKASDGVLATLLETLFLLAASADGHVGFALLREASSLLKKNRRLHTLLESDGGLFGLGGITDRAVTIAWQLQLLAASLAPEPARIGSTLADNVKSRRALLSEIFPAREAKTWLQAEFPAHLSALLEVPKPPKLDVAKPQGRPSASFCKGVSELECRVLANVPCWSR